MDQEGRGLMQIPLYRVWCGMKQRCRDKNGKSYARYGGRGITVCEEWKNDFSAFKKWAEENGYDERVYEYGKIDLDRIDNNGNYEPSNCRFVSRKVNSNNKSNNLIVEYRGEKLSLMELCRKMDIPYARTIQRYKRGLSIEECVAKPTRYVKYKHFGG